MKDGYVSVVIPAYNEEKYISRCLESVLNQTYAKLEIIIINDGSTDETDKVCSEYLNRDKRIKYIKQSNHGVAYAKRRGVELAEGEYIGFVDADDYIDKDLFEKLILRMSDVDLVTSGFVMGGKQLFDLFEPRIYKSKEDLKYICENMLRFEGTENRGLMTNLVNKLFKADKLKDVVSTTNLDVFVGEDAEIVYKYVLRCNSINITKICGYHYEFIGTSITHSINQNFIKNVNGLYFSLKEDFERTAYKEVLLQQLERWMWKHILNIPKFMGWKEVEKNIRFKYLNPYMNLLNNKRVILYGAGLVGQDYYKLYKKMKDYNLILWVDENWHSFCENEYKVQTVESIKDVEYDYILIAVKAPNVVVEIRKNLINVGVADEKIIWKQPIEMVE